MDVNARLPALGVMSLEPAAALLDTEVKKWTRVIKERGMRAD